MNRVFQAHQRTLRCISVDRCVDLPLGGMAGGYEDADESAKSCGYVSNRAIGFLFAT
jgi:hypothetical protein